MRHATIHKARLLQLCLPTTSIDATSFAGCNWTHAHAIVSAEYSAQEQKIAIGRLQRRRVETDNDNWRMQEGSGCLLVNRPFSGCGPFPWIFKFYTNTWNDTHKPYSAWNIICFYVLFCNSRNPPILKSHWRVDKFLALFIHSALNIQKKWYKKLFSLLVDCMVHGLHFWFTMWMLCIS